MVPILSNDVAGLSGNWIVSNSDDQFWVRQGLLSTQLRAVAAVPGREEGDPGWKKSSSPSWSNARVGCSSRPNGGMARNRDGYPWQWLWVSRSFEGSNRKLLGDRLIQCAIVPLRHDPSNRSPEQLQERPPSRCRQQVGWVESPIQRRMQDLLGVLPRVFAVVRPLPASIDRRVEKLDFLCYMACKEKQSASACLA